MDFDEWLISRLRAHGAYAGVMNGVYGRSVIDALKKFQEAEHLPVTGKADDATVNALRREGAWRDGGYKNVGTSVQRPSEPVWMREARRLAGTREIPGAKSNPIILDWAKKLGGWVASFYQNDDTAWCGLFVGNVIATTLPEEPLPKNPLGALEWGKLGRHMNVPALGAVMTFTRPGGGHVGLYAGEDDENYMILGGNQGNTVKVSPIAKDRLVETRWPATGEEPVGARVRATANGPVSRNEA